VRHPRNCEHGRARSARRGRSRLAALATALPGIGALLGACLPAFAAIGIYNWYPEPLGASAAIHYRLNTAAASGEVAILSGSQTVRTQTLSGDQLTRGAHTVTWDGCADSGQPLPDGSYTARISVKATSCPGLRGSFASFPDSPRYWGVAADLNPANNDQAHPERSTYGLVYVCDSASGTVEVFWPDQWAEALMPGQSMQPKAVLQFAPGAFSGGPWGISVGANGRLYTCAKFAGPAQGFWSMAADGTAPAFAPQATVCQDTLVTAGDACQLRASGADVEAVGIGPDGGYLDAAPADALRSAWTALSGTPAAVCGMGQGRLPGDSALYITAPGAADSLLRYLPSAGSTYSPDSSWRATGLGPSACGVDASPSAPLLAVGCQRIEDNLVFLDSRDGAAVQSATVCEDMVRSVRFDSAGNVLFDGGGLSAANMQTRAGVWFPPDSGSSDTRETLPFALNRAPGAPRFTDASVAPQALTLGGGQSGTLSAVVEDADGWQDVRAVTADLSGIGGPATAALQSAGQVSATAGRWTLTGVTPSTTARAGWQGIRLRAEDNAGASAETTAQVRLQGTQVHGTVMHAEAGFPIGGALVNLTDTLSGNVYTARSSREAADEGAFQVEVNPGVYSALASAACHTPGAGVTGLQVQAGGSPDEVRLTLGSVSVQEALDAPNGAQVCVEGVVSAQPAATDWASGGQTGFWDSTGSPCIKWYMQDAAGQNAAGLRVRDGQWKPVRGDRVVVSGLRQNVPGEEGGIGPVLHFARLAPGEPPAAQTVTLGALQMDSGNAACPDWGRYVEISRVSVVAGSRQSGTFCYNFLVSDGTSATAWPVRVWRSLGAGEKALPPDGAEITLRGIVSRLGWFQGNCLEPVSPEDYALPARQVKTIGEARELPLLTPVTVTGAAVVSFVPDAGSGAFYAEAQDGAAGIRVETAQALPREHDLVILSGHAAVTSSGERVIRDASFSIVGESIPKAWNIANKAASTTGAAPCRGPAAQGLLVKVWGKVLSVAPGSHFLLDDGSALFAGALQRGLKVVIPSGFPQENQWVSVTGVVAAEKQTTGAVTPVILGHEVAAGP